jgi:serine/threonine protein kinase
LENAPVTKAFLKRSKVVIGTFHPGSYYDAFLKLATVVIGGFTPDCAFVDFLKKQRVVIGKLSHGASFSTFVEGAEVLIGDFGNPSGFMDFLKGTKVAIGDFGNPSRFTDFLKGAKLVIGDLGHAVPLNTGESLRGMAGTLGYQAPEMLAGRPYDTSVDMCSFGVLLHILATGVRPRSLIDKGMVVGFRMAAEPELSANLQDLIRGLLTRAPTRRFTVEKADTHPFFTEVSAAAKQEK